MLSNSYIQFNCDGNLLKFYIDKSKRYRIQNYIIENRIIEVDEDEDGDEGLYIENLIGCITNRHTIDIKGIDGEYFQNVLLFFNNQLYRVSELYIDGSSKLSRKPKDIRELVLFRNNVRCLAEIDCTLASPIYPL